ncbi:Violaxanthin de-epoxidase [Durusdinium trenchii]|uniref:Chloroplastic n=1 Tax=Durusdinium trenchii TaxID=1381693 RepID=A0ABP0IYX8_9DINO
MPPATDDDDLTTWNAFRGAVDRGDLEEVNEMLENGCNPYQKVSGDGANWTVLMLAANAGHEELVQKFSKGGKGVSEKDSHGFQAMMLAALKGHTGVCRTLLERKADCNASNEYGETPLMMAAAMGHNDVVSMLLAANADANACDGNAMSAVKKASRWGHVDCLRTLLPKVNQDPREMKHCLLFGKLYDHPEVMAEIQKVLEPEEEADLPQAKAQQVLILRRLEGPALSWCLADAVCRRWIVCTPRCAQDDLPCQIRCGDLYKPTDASAERIDDFSECSISEHHCVAQRKLHCQRPERLPAGPLELQSLTGTWYITKGWNKLFDCFDCQVHHFSLQGGPKPLQGDLKYSVKKDLNCTGTVSHCEYLPREVHQSFAQDPANPMHLINHNNSAKEMHYMDDWYVLAARPDVYSLIYYCGCNDAVCGYAGSVLYTRSPHFEDLAPQDGCESW